MRLDKLTSKFQMALADAQSLAVGQDHQFIEPAHVMVALLDQQGGSVRGLLTKAGANVNLLRSQLGDAIDRLPKVEGAGGDVRAGQALQYHRQAGAETRRSVRLQRTVRAGGTR
jgi:ATP-dependent Clp protease ATP-binding subunit ClpB